MGPKPFKLAGYVADAAPERPWALDIPLISWWTAARSSFATRKRPRASQSGRRVETAQLARPCANVARLDAPARAIDRAVAHEAAVAGQAPVVQFPQYLL